LVKCLHKTDFSINTKLRGKITYLCPCGKCIACRVNTSSDWTARAVLETNYSLIKHHYNCYFLTLTYKDEALPIGKDGNPTLYKKDVQNFFKRLRKVCKFRYLFCGEYGSKSTARPHYHIMLWTDADYYTLRTSVDTLWGHFNALENLSAPFGKADVQPCRDPYKTAAYVAKYLTKYDSRDFADRDEKPFLRASVRLGMLGVTYKSKKGTLRAKAGIRKAVRSGQMSFTMNGKSYPYPLRLVRLCFTETERRANHLFHSGEYDEFVSSGLFDYQLPVQEKLYWKQQLFYKYGKK